MAQEQNTSSNAPPSAQEYRTLLFGSTERQVNSDDQLFRMAAEKLQNGYNLSADEYRSLGVGCVGYESYRKYFQNIAVVTAVYRDSPASKAGIKVGDKIVDNQKDNDFAHANPHIKQVQIRLAQAGAPIDITVLRDGKQEKVTLVRMNIEDIQETKYRKMWENTVRRLGFPKEGNYTGTSMRNLQPDSEQ
ncbi:MAG: PDZ domain-containing protein [Cyanobacteria bacterium TGS_CYA1]|nr:PDZ domain-containing protein [Cyanobacteria bacterium TGS_CYA1]